MTDLIDTLEDAIDEACDALRMVPQSCGSCGRYDCRDPKDAPELKSLLKAAEAAGVIGDRWDRRSLRLDPVTASALLHPRFPRFGIEPCEADADVIPEVINLGLSHPAEAAAIVWHLAQGRADQQALSDEAYDRFEELQELAAELAGGAA
jgi:hypothetical protein